jgi:site-specific recombinase XerD
MKTHNAENERIKRKYFAFLKEAKRQSEPTVDAAAKALSRFEVYNRYRDFRAFHFEQAVAFKNYLADQRGKQSGERLSKATLHATLNQLKRFFQWLAMQPGYKSRIQYTEAEYFNLSEKDTRIATAKRQQSFPTVEQVKHVISIMPSNTEIERRNRALIAFALLTGARDSAIASMKLKHVDLISGCVDQDAREVKTKFSKTFNTFFFPVGEEIRAIVSEWVSYLGMRNCGGMTIRCSRQRRLCLVSTGSSQREDWRGSTGEPPRPFGLSFNQLSSAPVCRTLTPIASEIPLPRSEKRSARRRSSSKLGARTWDTRKF